MIEFEFRLARTIATNKDFNQKSITIKKVITRNYYELIFPR